MVLPRDMKMQMHMLDVMYGLNDDWTLTLMVPWVRYSMNLNRRMTMMGTTTDTKFKTRNEGLGDIKVGSIYRAYDDGNEQVLLGLTLNLPTANFDEESNTPMRDDMRLGYPCRLVQVLGISPPLLSIINFTKIGLGEQNWKLLSIQIKIVKVTVEAIN